MTRWEHALDLHTTAGEGADQPIFLRIARAIVEDVRRGRLRPGDALPGSRTLATSLEVHRNTVLAAYRELSAEGWIETRPAGGTYVTRELPDPSPRRFSPKADARSAVPLRTAFDLPPAGPKWESPAHARGTLVMAHGAPDARLVPVAALARAYRRALRRGGTVLGYGDPRGRSELRDALAAMLSHLRGIAASRDTLMVTRGSQMALDLVARTLVRPGDVVAVEALGYRPAWNAFEAAGARLVPIPVDEGGLRVDLLAALAEKERVRAVYVTPHHQYPTTVTLAPGRRLELLELARSARFAVVEDDFDFEFHYEGRPVLPLASADVAGSVIYIGTLSKILAPGLRIGFVVAPPPLIERLATLRTVVDRQGDPAVELAVADMIDDAEVQRHARRIRKLYRLRRDTLLEALEEHLSGVVEAKAPAGGMAMWVKIAPEVDVDAWAERGLAQLVAFAPGRYFAFDGKPRAAARLGYAALEPRELREAVRRMATALRTKKRRTA